MYKKKMVSFTGGDDVNFIIKYRPNWPDGKIKGGKRWKIYKRQLQKGGNVHEELKKRE